MFKMLKVNNPHSNRQTVRLLVELAIDNSHCVTAFILANIARRDLIDNSSQKTNSGLPYVWFNNCLCDEYTILFVFTRCKKKCRLFLEPLPCSVLSVGKSTKALCRKLLIIWIGSWANFQSTTALNLTMSLCNLYRLWSLFLQSF